MVRITDVYIDTILAFFGVRRFFSKPIFTAYLDVCAWLLGHMLFLVSYMHVFDFFFFLAFASGQGNWACFTQRRSGNTIFIIINIIIIIICGSGSSSSSGSSSTTTTTQQLLLLLLVVAAVVVVVVVALLASVLWYCSKHCEPPVHNVRKDTVMCPSKLSWKSSLGNQRKEMTYAWRWKRMLLPLTQPKNYILTERPPILGSNQK